MHTFIKAVNGYKINHWTLGDCYYIQDEQDWIFKDKELSKVEDYAAKLEQKIPWFK